MQEQAAEKNPCRKRKQRQMYFQEDTWILFCSRKDVRQQHRSL